MDPHAIKCVFLVYSRTQKGYQCYSPMLHQFFTCKDVTLFESTPYFSEPIFATDLTNDLPLPVIGMVSELDTELCHKLRVS